MRVGNQSWQSQQENFNREKEKENCLMARRRRNLGFLNLTETNRRVLTTSATAAAAAVVVQKGFDWLAPKLPVALRGNYALNAVKVGGAMLLLSNSRGEFATAAAAGMVVSAVYDIGEEIAKQIPGLKSRGLRGYAPAPRLSTRVNELSANHRVNNLGAYAPATADSTNLKYTV